MKYDVVIVGSGLGGLQCAYILSKEGYNVCLLEKNLQLGGCLQTFKRDGSIFDTGMHYIGSMDEGQTLEKYFRYFGLSGKIKLKRMDQDGYDVVRFGGKEYKFAMGHDRFIDTMLQYFPNEREALTKYIAKIKEVSNSVDLYNMRDFKGVNTSYFEYFGMGINDFIDSITSNPTLKSVLLGTLSLYAGVKDKTPLYIPLIIHSSYIESAYRFVDGGSQITEVLAQSIELQGGTILKKSEVTNFIFNNNKLEAVEINHSERIEGRIFISNMHPKKMLEIMETPLLKPAYRHRINDIEDTCGIFSLYMVMKKNSFKYLNQNYYHFDTDNVWDGDKYTEENWPRGYMMHVSPDSENEGYADNIIINTYMHWDDVKGWENTTVEKRGDDYKAMKQRKAEILIDVLERNYPELRKCIKSYYTSTPLTYRDYTGTSRGSIYGVLKDFHNPLKSMILPKTKVPNLLLTGQNINIHGVVGVTICSIITCSEILGMSYLINKVRHA
jgi:all-trans-retinol 13,14-reductase